MVDTASKKIDYSLIQLSIPEIISALHQKAISTCPSNLRIANSAIEGDGKSAKLNSAGQHIISILAAKEGDKVKKDEALKALQAYVKAFVGPDLANKVTKDVILELGNDDSKSENQDQSQQQEDKNQEEEEEKTGSDNSEDDSQEESNADTEEKPQEKQQKESIEVKSFKRFLIEDCGMRFLFEENDKQQQDGQQENNDQSSKNDKEDDKEALGWYIAYDLKVQGLKETNLKDAMKDFATSFFDNLKITASGLFGGGQEITGKDIRKKFHDLMHVDHKKLASNVADYLRKKFPNVEDTSVEARDSKTLYNEIKSFITKDEKAAVNSAAYCLRIKVREEDRKKPFFNKKKIAEIIRKCMAGFRLGKKAAVTEDSIIKIEDFKDKNDSKEEGRNAKRPDSIQIKTLLSNDQIKKKFGDEILKLKPDTKISNSDAIKIYDGIRNKFKSAFSPDALKEKENKEAKKIVDDLEAKIKLAKDDPIEAKVFIEFYKKYSDFEKSIGESAASFSFIKKNDVVKNILEMLFEDFSQSDLVPSQILDEGDEDKNDNGAPAENGEVKSEKCKKTLEDIKTQWKTLINKSDLKTTNDYAKGFIVKKDDILQQLASFSNVDKLKSEFDKNKEFNYGIAIDFSKNPVLAESQQQFTINSICNLLFEEKKTRENLNQNDKDFLEVKDKLKDGKLKRPDIFDAVAKKKREMTNAEVFSALKNGTMVYTGNEIKIPDLKKLVSAATIKASADNANSQEENKNFGVFDSIKEFTNLSDQSFGQLIKLIGKEQNESIFPVQGNYLLERRKNSILRAYKTILLEGHSKEQNDVEREIDRIGVENITNNVDQLRKNYLEHLSNIQKKNKDNEYVQKIEVNSKNWISKEFIGKLRDQKEANVDTIKKMLKDCVSRVGKTNDIRFELQALVEAMKQLPDGPSKNEDEKITITFKDVDDPSELSNSEEPTDEDKEKYKTIKEISLIPGEDVDIPEVKDKGNFQYLRFDPDPENMDESGDTYATYIKNEDDGKKIEKFQVMFMVLKDPTDPKSEEIIVKVNDLETQEVEKGKHAIKPAIKDIPKVDGYDFVDWGEAEKKLENVTEDIIAVGQYRKHINETTVFAMPFAYYQDTGDNESDLELGNAEDSGNEPNQPTGGNDLYVFPIASSKDFETTPEVGND